MTDEIGKVRKHFTSCYRITIDAELFGQISKEKTGEFKGQWFAEIRVSKTGDPRRMAGIWPTKKEAVAEIMWHVEDPSRI